MTLRRVGIAGLVAAVALSVVAVVWQLGQRDSPSVTIQQILHQGYLKRIVVGQVSTGTEFSEAVSMTPHHSSGARVVYLMQKYQIQHGWFSYVGDLLKSPDGSNTCSIAGDSLAQLNDFNFMRVNREQSAVIAESWPRHAPAIFYVVGPCSQLTPRKA